VHNSDWSWIPSFAATIVAMMAIQMSSLGFSPLLPSIQKEFGLSYSQIGLFTGLYGLVAIAVSVPAGILAKRAGKKLALSAGLLGVALGLLLLSRASSYQGALGARVVWLIGYRVAFVCVTTSIALVAPAAFRRTDPKACETHAAKPPDRTPGVPERRVLCLRTQIKAVRLWPRL
jgi:predicted MFS family arabinose efflux permease